MTQQAKSSITIRRVSVDDLLSQAGDLTAQHGEEVEGEQPQPDDLRYRALEAAGKVLCLGVFDGDSLIGYSVLLLGHDLHHAGRLIAQSDALFLVEGERRRGLGRLLVIETMALARAFGAEAVDFHAVPNSTFETFMLAHGVTCHHGVYRRPC